MSARSWPFTRANEPGPYPAEVRHRIRRDIQADYPRTSPMPSTTAASNVVSVQYEPGIWGGEDGAYVLDFVRALRVPMVATLHDVAAQPNARAAGRS